MQAQSERCLHLIGSLISAFADGCFYSKWADCSCSLQVPKIGADRSEGSKITPAVEQCELRGFSHLSSTQPPKPDAISMFPNHGSHFAQFSSRFLNMVV